MEANPKKIKPKGMNLFLGICLKLLIDLIPNNIGTIAAWKWANNKIVKNKINAEINLSKDLIIKIHLQIILVKKDTIDLLQ